MKWNHAELWWRKICLPGENQSTIRNCLRKTKILHVFITRCHVSVKQGIGSYVSQVYSCFPLPITSPSRFLILLLPWTLYSFFFLFRVPSFSFFFIFLICKSTISPVVSESECFLPAWHPRISIFSLSAHSLNFIFFFKKKSCLKSVWLETHHAGSAGPDLTENAPASAPWELKLQVHVTMSLQHKT